MEWPFTLPVTLAPFRHDTEIDSVPSSDEPVCEKLTEKVPEPPESPFHVPFHSPSTVVDGTGLPVAENDEDEAEGSMAMDDDSPAGVPIAELLEELEHAAKRTPQATIVPNSPKAVGCLIARCPSPGTPPHDGSRSARAPPLTPVAAPQVLAPPRNLLREFHIEEPDPANRARGMGQAASAGSAAGARLARWTRSPNRR